MDRDSRIPLHTGRDMPVMGLGTWELTQDTAGVVEAAIAEGYRMIDTACDYGSQPGIGEAIERSDTPRAELFVVTKIEEDDDPYEGVRRDLGELRLDYADLTLIHRPPPSGSGEELWKGLIRAKQEGLVKDIGVSNYSAELVDALVAATGELPVVNQVEWSPFGHSGDLLRHHAERRVVIQAYSPLTRGRRLDDTALSGFAQRYGKTAAQILIRWNLQRGTVPLPKANRPAHFRENFDVCDFEIAEDDMAALDRLNVHYSALGDLPYVA